MTSTACGADLVEAEKEKRASPNVGIRLEEANSRAMIRRREVGASIVHPADPKDDPLSGLRARTPGAGRRHPISARRPLPLSLHTSFCSGTAPGLRWPTVPARSPVILTVPDARRGMQRRSLLSVRPLSCRGRHTCSMDKSRLHLSPGDHAPTHTDAKRVLSRDEMKSVDWSGERLATSRTVSLRVREIAQGCSLSPHPASPHALSSI